MCEAQACSKPDNSYSTLMCTNVGVTNYKSLLVLGLGTTASSTQVNASTDLMLRQCTSMWSSRYITRVARPKGQYTLFPSYRAGVVLIPPRLEDSHWASVVVLKAWGAEKPAESRWHYHNGSLSAGERVASLSLNPLRFQPPFVSTCTGHVPFK